MKIVILVVLMSLQSLLALAQLRLNDSVTYNGKLTLLKENLNVGFLQELSVSEISADGKSLTIQTILFDPSGKENINKAKVPVTEIQTKAQILELLSKCEAQGGKKEKLSVAAGVFETCHLRDNKNEIWLGDVPFNVVKQVEFDQDGNRIEIELGLIQAAK